MLALEAKEYRTTEPVTEPKPWRLSHCMSMKPLHEKAEKLTKN
jgi:hypothetical protein